MPPPSLLSIISNYWQNVVENNHVADVSANLNQRLSSQEVLYALAPGIPEEGTVLVSALSSHHQKNPQNQTLLNKALLHKTINSDAHIISFSWLAHIKAYQNQQRPSEKSSLHAHHSACSLFKKSLALCHQSRERENLSINRISLIILRILRIWSCGHILKNKKGKNEYFQKAIECSLLDLRALCVHMHTHSSSIPLFLSIDIAILLSIAEHLITQRQTSHALPDPWLNELSIQFLKTLEKSQNKELTFFQIPKENTNSSLWLSSLSSTLNELLQEENGKALFTSDPAIHAHIFSWLYAFNSIINCYANSHHTISNRLNQLLRIVSRFSPSPPDKPNIHPQHTFLSLTSSLHSCSSPFLPISPHTLSTFIAQQSLRQETPLNSTDPLQEMGYQHITSRSLSLHIQHSISLPTYHKRYPLDNLHDTHSLPLNFYLNTGERNLKTPLFSQPTQPHPTLPFLQNSGIGFSLNNKPQNHFLNEQCKTLSPELQKISIRELHHICSPIMNLPKIPSSSKYVQLYTAGFCLDSIKLYVIRQLFFTASQPTLIGIDTLQPFGPPQEHQLLYHTSFFCPQSCIVAPSQNRHINYIKQNLANAQYLWTLEILPSPSLKNPQWQNVHHAQTGTWIFHQNHIPANSLLHIPWSLSLQKHSKKKTKYHEVSQPTF